MGDRAGVAAGAVVDNEVHLDFILCGLLRDPRGILDRLRVQHSANRLVMQVGNIPRDGFFNPDEPLDIEDVL